jgi:N-acetylmuramoyl-L-alanine amidase
MRDIKYIVLHCTAGPQDQPTSEILKFWKNVNGWANPGYHHEINADGSIEDLHPIEKIANGVAGYNKHSIHISYKGGIDAKGRPVDNRTSAQKQSQIELITKYKTMFPNAVVLGHRDFSTDKNGNGIIDRWEWIKSCPAFDVRDWMISIDLDTKLKPTGIIYKLNYPLIKNNTVGQIQLALVKQGYKMTIDKVFGRQTADAIIDFQKKNGLTADGQVGPSTAEKLKITL